MNAQKIEAERWLKQAKADLAVAQTLLSTEHYAAACFHAQQGAEKALKSVLITVLQSTRSARTTGKLLSSPLAGIWKVSNLTRSNG